VFNKNNTGTTTSHHCFFPTPSQYLVRSIGLVVTLLRVSVTNTHTHTQSSHGLIVTQQDEVTM